MYNFVNTNTFKEKSKHIEMNMTGKPSINGVFKLLVLYNIATAKEDKNYFETKLYYFEDYFHCIQ